MKQIYTIKNKINNKEYIGSTNNMVVREKWHRSHLNCNKGINQKLQHAWNKYGEENFEFVILEETDENIFKLEEKYILSRNTIKEGYNIRLPHSDTELFKNCRKGLETFLKTNGPLNLKVITKENWIKEREKDSTFTITKMRNKNQIERMKKFNIIGVDNLGEIIHTFSSTAEAYRHFQKNYKDHIAHSLKLNNTYPNRFSKVQGFYWFSPNQFNKEKFLEIFNKPKLIKEKLVKPRNEWNIKRNPISLINITTKEIKNFSSHKEAANFLESNSGLIRALVNGKKLKEKNKWVNFTQLKGWKINLEG